MSRACGSPRPYRPKALPAALSISLALTSPGLAPYSAFAQSVSQAAAVPGAVPAGSAAGAALGLPAPVQGLLTGSLLTAPLTSALPTALPMGLPLASPALPEIIPPTASSPAGGLGVLLKNLSGPSAVADVPPHSPADAFSAAGEREFHERLGLGKTARGAAVPADEPAAGLSKSLLRRLDSSRARSGKGVVPASAARPRRRSALFPAILAGATASVGGVLHMASTALYFGAQAAAGTAAVPALLGGAGLVLGAASGVVLVLSGVLAAYALAEVGAFSAAVLLGRGVTDAEFHEALKAELRRLPLTPGAAAALAGLKPSRGVVRPFRPARRTLSFGLTAGRRIYLRPELVRIRWLFRLVLKHELSHFFADEGRGPPPRRSLPGRLLADAVSEVFSRLSDFKTSKWLRTLSVPLPERALREAGFSLRLGRDYEVLIKDADKLPKDWTAPEVYSALSEGKARARILGAPGAAAQGAAESQAPPGLPARAFVAPASWLKVPEPGSREGKRLALALRHMDDLYLMSRKLAATAGDPSEGGGIRHLEHILGTAERLRRNGKLNAKVLERLMGQMWHQVASAYLQGVGAVRALQEAYEALDNKGLLLLPWPESERGLAEAEKLLRHWQSGDGGRFRVTRVDLAEGGHVLVARKAEARVHLWLKTQGGRTMAKSTVNVPEADAPRALEEAGYSPEQIDQLREADLQVRHVFGEDVGSSRLYVSVPRSRAKALRQYALKQGIEVEASEGGFDIHVIESADLQNVRPTWKLGITGRGGKIYDIDTGLDAGHPDFAAKLAEVLVDDVVGEGPEDWQEHGTFKAAEEYSDGPLYKGMAPDAAGRMGKVFSKDGAGASDGDIMAAAVLAIQWGADVVSVSLGSPGDVDSPLAEFFTGLISKSNASGHRMIGTGSAGNSGPSDRTLSQPSVGRMMISVAAAIKDKILSTAFYSSVGPGIARKHRLPRVALKPEVTASGGNVTTRPGSKDVYEEGIEAAKSRQGEPSPSDTPDGLHRRMSGTSMSNPMVAAIAVLVKLAILATTRAGSPARLAFVEVLPFAVKMILMRSAADMAEPVVFQGAGYVDALAAVKLAVASFADHELSFAGRTLRRSGLMPEFKGRTEGWEWILRVKELWDLEDKIYAESDAAALDTEDKAVQEGASPQKTGVRQGGHAAAQRRFNELSRSEEVVGRLLKALKDPVWVVRLYAAFTLINLKVPQAVPAAAQAQADRGSLIETALYDEDARVRQTAFLAIGETPTHVVDELLRQAAANEQLPPDVPMYAAYTLARHGDGSAIGRILGVVSGPAKSPDRQRRFTAAWLLGQLGRQTPPAASDALAVLVQDDGEQGNIRHLAAASLSNVALENSASVTDGAVLAVLASAGTQNLALTRTIHKFFSAASRRKELAERLRAAPLREPLEAFVRANKAWSGKPGPLGELVSLLARLLNIPLESPTPVPDAGGTGVPGVDPNLGPVHLLVELPKDRPRIQGFSDLRAESRAQALQALALWGLSPETLSRHEAAPQAAMPVSNSLWVNVPEHKVTAFVSDLEAQGFRVRRAKPLYRLIHETGPALGMPELRQRMVRGGKGVLVAYVDEGGDDAHPGIASSRIKHKHNFTDEGGPEDVASEGVGHGTHGMGIVGAQAVEGSPYVGMAPDVDFAVIKVLGANGGSEATVMAGLEKAASLVEDPLKTPVVVNLSLGGPGGPGSPVGRLVTRLALKNIVVVTAAGNEGPAENTVSSPANAPLAISIGALEKSGRLAFYSSRGVPGRDQVTRVNMGGAVSLEKDNPYEIVSSLNTRLAEAAKDAATTVLWLGKALYQMMSGTSMAAPHETGVIAVLIEEMASVLVARFGSLPDGYGLWLDALLSRTAASLPNARHEVGAGRTDPPAAEKALKEALQDPDKVKAEAEAMMAEARKKYGEAPPAEPTGGWFRRLVGRAVRRAAMPAMALVPDGALEAAATAAGQRMTTSEKRAEGSAEAWKRIKSLRRVLGDGTRQPDGGFIEPFGFRLPDGSWTKARSAGLEGFLYSKLELERRYGPATGQAQDYFPYLDALLAPVEEEWASRWRAQFAELGRSEMNPSAKNRVLNRLLTRAVGELQALLRESDPSLASRRASAYMILARAYNRLRPGKNFFDSIDEEELLRIRRKTKATDLWLLDIFEIGKTGRWGTGGGSPYAITGYRVKEELGGEEAFQRFKERAHRLGFTVRADFIPNHVSLDGDLLKTEPESLLHVVPPQHLSDEDILRSVPRERIWVPGEQRYVEGELVFYLASTDAYPEGGRRVSKRILVHRPRTDAYRDDNRNRDMWLDMLQLDITRTEARRWLAAQARGLVERGFDGIRADMAYYLVNAKFLPHWLGILGEEREWAQGWMREAMDALVAGMRERSQTLGGSEAWEEIVDEGRDARLGFDVFYEAYAYATDLSRAAAGTGSVYNKGDYDPSLGQFGLYKAIAELRDPVRIREALRNVTFRLWQKGGVGLVNFAGTHDAFEGNPVDVFGPLFRAVAATTLLLRPTLIYNGFELGVGQREMLIGDLSKSTDLQKAIPFDIPVLIDWAAGHPERQLFIERLLNFSHANSDLFTEGALEVLEPTAPSPIVAYSAGRSDPEGRNRVVIMAANFSQSRAGARFAFGEPVLKDFGAFQPRADRRYRLLDHADVGPDGRPKAYERTGRELLDSGLTVILDGGAVHLFEVEELDEAAPPQGPPQEDPGETEGLQAWEDDGGPVSAAPAPGPVSTVGAKDPDAFRLALEEGRPSAWDRWTRRLTDSSMFIFAALQLPQIIKNFSNLAAGNASALSILPWMGYSTGILANLLMLALFVNLKDASPARVQAVGVLTSLLVVGQIFFAGFMPLAAFALVLPAIGAGLALNYARWKGRLSDRAWARWEALSGALGLAVLAPVFWATFVGPGTLVVGLASAAAAAALLWLDASGRLSEKARAAWGSLGAWTATMLFMFGPVAQLVNNAVRPEEMAGIALGTLLLATLGNLVMLPRAMLTQNRIWFVGSSWAVFAGGLAVMASMLLGGYLPAWAFWSAAAVVLGSLGLALRLTQRHRGDPSPLDTLRFLVGR